MTTERVIIIRNAKIYDFGGAERFPVFLAKELTKLNYEPIVVSRSPKLLAFAKDNKIDTIRGWWWSWQNWSGKLALLFPVYVMWQIALTIWYLGLFVRKNPSVIHIQSKDDFIAATWAGKLLGKRVVWTDHADLKHIWKNIHIWYKNPVGKLVYHAAKHADVITVVSKSELAFVSDNLGPKSPVRRKLHVIYNGILDSKSHYKPKSNGKIFTFCVVSRLVTDKGIREVIEAFAKLSTDYPNTKLTLIGDGPEEARFTRMAGKYKNIELYGYQKDPLKFINESDVFVQPTYHEGFSVSLVEASMLEKPIIATSVGGNIEIINDHDTGILVPAKDADALYDAMKLLYSDGMLRQRLAKNARNQYEKRFQFDQIVKDSFILLYKRSDQ